MPNNNAIGTGALILSANADKMLADVDKAVKGAKQKTSQLADTKEGIWKFASGAAFGVGAGKVVEWAGKATTALMEMATQAAKFRAEMERAAQLSAEVAKAGDRMTREMDERLAIVTNPAERLDALAAAIKRGENELSGYQAAASAAREELQQLNSSFGKNATDSWKLWLAGGLDGAKESVKSKIDDALGSVSKWQDRLAELRKEAARIKMPETDPKLIAGANQLAEVFEKQRKTLGMTAEEVQIYDLKMQGATDGMLAKAKEQLKLLEQARKEFAPVQLAGALSKGSTEAYSLTAKFQAAGTLAEGQAKKQEAVGKEQVRMLGLILKELTGVEVMKVG